jgi:UDPglucose 6-dehydrogenase
MFLIAGYGYVGKAVFESIVQSGQQQPIVIDPAIPELRTWDEVETQYLEGVIICVATPQGVDGSCDYSNVLEVLSHVPENLPVLLKSTISLEGWHQIKEHYPNHKIAFSPEFLTANNAIDDFKNQSFIILSGDMIPFWRQFYTRIIQIFQPRPAPLGTFHICSPEEAILAKYASNAFLAVKVGFFNHIYDLANLAGADYDKIREMLGERSQIGLNHTEVTPERGWGGHCFPKDTSALMQTAADYKYDMTILRAAIEYNNNIRTGD